jgi:hypothetical protein
MYSNVSWFLCLNFEGTRVLNLQVIGDEVRFLYILKLVRVYPQGEITRWAYFFVRLLLQTELQNQKPRCNTQLNMPFMWCQQYEQHERNGVGIGIESYYGLPIPYFLLMKPWKSKMYTYYNITSQPNRRCWHVNRRYELCLCALANKDDCNGSFLRWLLNNHVQLYI